MSGVRERRIKDDSYKWVDGGPMDWDGEERGKERSGRNIKSSMRGQEQEALRKGCVRSTNMGVTSI